jgi:hypothetical protein
MSRYYGFYSSRSRGARKKKLARQNTEIENPILIRRHAQCSSWTTVFAESIQ